MAFDFDIECVKENSIPHLDALSILRFKKSQKIKQKKNLKIYFFHLVETDILSLDRMTAKTRHDPVG